MFSTTYNTIYYIFDTDSITYDPPTTRPMRPQLWITAYVNGDEHCPCECSYSGAIVQSCSELLAYLDEHYPELLV